MHLEKMSAVVAGINWAGIKHYKVLLCI